MTYHPDLASVNSHPLPDWFDAAKFGIFIHWGLYSIPAFAPRGQDYAERLLKGDLAFGESPYAEWYQNSLRIEGSPVQQYHAKTYGADFRYEKFAPLFNEQIHNWDPGAWAGQFARAGAGYVVLVTKHHDGFLMWNSRHSNPRTPNWQASRDIAGELSRAVNAQGMKMGFYYSSLLDWSFTPAPITSLAELFAGSDTSQEYLAYIENHWLELIERYDPWILWSDIGCPPGIDLPRLFAHYYNRKPEGVVNDRWMQLPKFLFNRPGRFILTKMLAGMDPSRQPKPAHCDFVTPEYATLDHIEAKKWETCRGIGNSFGYNQFESAGDYQKAEDLIRLLADVVSKNGNLLLNVGPLPDGSIPPLQAQALDGMGSWLKVNGEAIYSTHPWVRFTDPTENGAEVRYTSRDRTLYIIIMQRPADGILALPPEAAGGDTTLLATGDKLQVDISGDVPTLKLPHGETASPVPVIKVQLA